MSVALVQADVQVCFGVGVRLIDEIPRSGPPAPSARGVASGRVADNSSSFASSNPLYRRRSVAFTADSLYVLGRAFYICAIAVSATEVATRPAPIGQTPPVLRYAQPVSLADAAMQKQSDAMGSRKAPRCNSYPFSRLSRRTIVKR
jgi:hypothetical protein